MFRAAGTFLILVTLLASAAAAAQEPVLPAETAPSTPARLLGQAGDAIASGASATAAGVSAAAGGVASLAAATGAALVGAAKALGSAALFLLDAIGSGLAALARGIGVLFTALFDLAGAALAGLGAALMALGGLLASLGTLLGGLLGKGAGAVRAHPAPSTIAAGSAAGAGLLAWVVKRLGGLGFLASLYTRLAPSQILDNEARASVYEHVKTHPGAHPSAIAQQLDLGWGTVVYHLAKLEGNRLVTARSAHNKKCYFALGAELDAEGRTAVAAMSTDKTRSIVEAVRASPGISQKELSERLGMSQALASWHVKRLVASGVLLAARQGRSNCLRVAGHVPVAA